MVKILFFHNTITFCTLHLIDEKYYNDLASILTSIYEKYLKKTISFLLFLACHRFFFGQLYLENCGKLLAESHRSQHQGFARAHSCGYL